jgi:16S rRNA processing protein RimM
LSSNSANNHQNDDAADSDIIIGRIVSVNVPRKQLRIAPETSYPERFRLLQELRIKTKEGGGVCLTPSDIRITQKAVIVSVSVESDNEIASLRGATVVVHRSERFPLPDDEYYIDDLVGLVVKDIQGNVIGRLTEVWETPANDIYQVLDDHGTEILLPAIGDVILEVDIEGRQMVADITNLV